jgi:energy-coupling factor transport system permease protein
MNLDVMLGQYCDRDSVMHRLDPRFKIVLAMAFIVCVFMAKSVYSFALLTLFSLAMIIISKIPVPTVLRGLRPVMFIVVFTAIVNIFWYKGDTLILHYWVLSIYKEGLINALLIVLRIVLMLAGSSLLLTYTTTPISLTDGLERLLAPLAKLKLPVHEFSMMMTIALRFIPTLMEETTKIMNAQKARGADFSSGSLMKRAKALVPIIVPLFVSAFRRAEELAVAMECRCYTGGEGRSRMTVLKAGVADYVFTVVVAALIAAVVLINKYSHGYSLSI